MSIQLSPEMSCSGRYGTAGQDAVGSFSISTLSVESGQRRFALGMVALSVAGLIVGAPFAKVPLPQFPAFIPAYEATLLFIDLVTAVLLFGQFVQLRSAALLALAAGYLYDALLVIPHALSFPGFVTPGGWLGTGGQTTAWLYCFWHGGFPLFVLAYVALDRHAAGWTPRVAGRLTVPMTCAGVIGLALLLTWVASQSDGILPALVVGNAFAPILVYVIGAIWLITLVAVVALAWNRPHSVLDIWLIAVMCAWLADIALSAGLNGARFDFGYYAGRIYGLLAASLVLGVLLFEMTGLHARLAALTQQLRDHNRNLDARVRERTAEVVETNRRLNAVMQSSPVAIIMLDPQGIVLLWTGAAEQVFGYTEAEALGRLPPYLTEDDLDDFRAIIGRIINEETAAPTFETSRTRKDGTPINISGRWTRVVDDAGELLGIMFAIEDISSSRRLETQVRHLQKMEAIGNLTGGMAHDFNNLLGIIIGSLDLLRDEYGKDPDIAELTSDALDAALRGADLTRRLLAFARRQPLQPERTDVNTLVGNITHLLKRTLGEDIEVTLELGDGVWPVVVDPAQLESSLTNLANNARDAMKGGGHLIIVTDNRYLDEDYAAEHPDVQVGEYVVLEVSDTGTGMPPDVAARIFEPFFTTKETGKGTGLGLSMVFGFMKQSGGHINVYSESGIGTTFRLYLPRADASAAAEGATAAPPLARGKGETVLAVEDNASLRRVVVRQLSELGYRVIEADAAQAAIDILQDQEIDLLLTDIVMPGGISGYDLARMAQARWPETKVVMTSGFPELKVGRDADAPNLRLLSKPYRRDDLARVIGEVLEEDAEMV